MSLKYEIILVDNTEAVTLNPPANVKAAQVQVMQGSGQSDSVRVIAMMRTGDTPNATNSIILGEGNIVDLKGFEVRKAKFIGLEAGVTHELRVDYFKG